jgi:hypothetical protein
MPPLARLALVAIAVVAPAVSLAGELLPPDRPIHEAIDHYLDLKIQQAGVAAAPQADEATLLRRTTLDLVGRPAAPPEIKAYLASPDAAKREQLVDRLMASPGFARHQAVEFDTLLMYGTRASVREYLLVAFQENRPWDRMFRELLLGEENDAEQKRAITFVKSRVSDLDKLASETSSIFFGVNVSCAQCHNHPLVPEWTQDHFYGMKSFFSRTFENGGFLGEREYGLVKYKTVEGEQRDAKLMFLTGTIVSEPEAKEPTKEEEQEEKKRLEELKKNKQPPPPPGFSRRAQLVSAALAPSERNYFARSIVNQLWARFYGRGLVNPIDQMHPENVASHAELLDWLARDLADHGYDLRRLTRGLVLSQAYARASRWEQSPRPEADLFAVAALRPLAPMQYGMTLKLGSTSPDQFAADMKSEDLEKRIEGLEGAARGLASNFEQPRGDFQISVSEALLLNNGDKFTGEFLRDAGDSLVGKLKTIEDRRQLVETAAWSVLGRAPDDEEIKLLGEFLDRKGDRKLDACRQLVWAMLTSSECRFNY